MHGGGDMTIKVRPILMSAPMIRAELAGYKSQTRRIVKDPGLYAIGFPHDATTRARELIALASQCPYGVPGDLLWVRETWARRSEMKAAIYKADEVNAIGAYGAVRWTPSIYMPRWASRLTLRITGVRVEQLQDISEADARAEGIAFTLGRDPYASGSAACRWASAVHPDRAWNSARAAYEELWEHINGPGSWAENPWVWCISFSCIGKNVDAVLADMARAA